jgi:hypothetical protein
MAKTPRDVRPIQVFLDTQRFIEMEEPQPFGGGSKDFFAGNDKGFATHKTRIQARATSVADGIRRSGEPAGFVRVQQREVALAKSHRPLGSLFTEANNFSLVGVDGVGEMLFQATPSALDRLASIIATKAEETPLLKPNKSKDDALEPRASRYRSEVGGIDDIQLYGASDKIKFSAAEAVAWFNQPNIIGGYIVELFRPNRKVGGQSTDALIKRLRDSLEKLTGGLLIRPFLPSARTVQYGMPTLALSVQLLSENQRQIELPFLADGRASEMSESSLTESIRRSHADMSLSRHTELLNVLASQSLVRSIELPPTLETAPTTNKPPTRAASFSPPTGSSPYPVVGVIDGGVSSARSMGAWIVGDAGLVPTPDRDESHGTFIAGLICAGASLNPGLIDSVEPLGCKVYDLDLFPRRELRTSYYPDLEDLFDTLDEKIQVAKRDFNVRIFNLSFAIGNRTSRLSYSITADRLDRIARAHDVIFVVASGNLSSTVSRPPWPEKTQDAVAMLASVSSFDQQISAPSDQLLGITVGAVNPSGVPGHIAFMPTTYTRRGPGVGGSPKPDLVQCGGAGYTSNLSSGLQSVTPTGDTTDGCGTSYASPLTAATLATLDHLLASQAPRETLLALPIHRAQRPFALEKPALRPFARDFVGFGLTPTAEAILSDAPHSVTLVFSAKLLRKQRLEFAFTWPKSLVAPNGTCRGRADVTLAYTPPIDPDHREEAVRVQLEAHLHQEQMNVATGETAWESRLEHDGADVAQGTGKTESFLIKTGLKWSPVKRYHVAMKKGRGNTSNWRISLESLERALVIFPPEGVNFSLILTLSDIAQAAQIREELRASLRSRGLQLADITVAHRVVARSA